MPSLSAIDSNSSRVKVWICLAGSSGVPRFIGTMSGAAGSVIRSAVNSPRSLYAADGETFLLYSQIGFWKKLTYKKLPHSKFIVQEDSFAMNELVKNSTLPSFVTDVSIKNGHLPKNKIAVPIVDEDVSVTYYAICLKGRSWRLLERFMNNRLQTQA